jgi:hypothetical protein
VSFQLNFKESSAPDSGVKENGSKPGVNEEELKTQVTKEVQPTSETVI